MTFRTVLELGGKNATGICVPDSVVEGLGSGKRPAVCVTINGYAYRSTIAPMGGVFMIPVSAEIRKNAGVSAGDSIEVEVVLDTAPREVSVPEDFAAALSLDTDAKRFFEGLSYSNRKKHVTLIEEAKSAEARLKRIEKAIIGFRDGRC